MRGICSTRLITPEGIHPGCVYWEDEKICAVTEKPLEGVELLDVGSAWVTAGFIDLHTHGGGGWGFDGSEEDIVEACNFHLAHGTTCIYPTLSSAPIDDLAASVEKITQAIQNPNMKPTVPGVHLEGPYFSLAQMGAQRPKFITPPIREEYLPLLDQHSNHIARWDYAPENDTDQAFAKALRDHGVLAGAAHTDALYEDMLAAIAEGLAIVTHLYSCTSTITRDHGFRRLGVVETAWLEDDLYVEAIADGKHLPPALLKMIWKLKGSHRVALITDSLQWAGVDKEGLIEGTDCLIEDGVCKMPDRNAFQGSIATTDRLLRVAVQEAGIPITEAVRMLTETPAAIMGLQTKGLLAEGFDADILVLDENLFLQKIVAMGKGVSE